MINEKLSKILLRIWGPLIICISWYLSSRTLNLEIPISHSDKLIHLICFSGLAGAWTFWFSGKNWRNHSIRNFIICIAIVVIYGIIDEIHQNFVPGRESSVFDWFADVIGAVIGTIAGRWIMIKSIRKTGENNRCRH